jgi:hypothetical protein
MIWKMFEVQGLLDGQTSNEINLVFDNCAGQNKNRMVYRMLFYMVKLKVCKTARAIFLVKGHTKNDCDRMFNLMKFDYRKVNCYTPPELLELVNKHPQVTAIPMAPSDFKDWDALENQMISKMDGVSKNHVFTVRDRDPNVMLIQEWAGDAPKRQVLVRKAFQNVDWKDLFKLSPLVPPGLPDIKWNELYSKWGRFVPEDRKSGLKYFVEEPPDSLKKSIAEQNNDARQARAKRTRGSTVDGNEKHVNSASTKKPPNKKSRRATKK